MSTPPASGRRRLTRADLPDELTPQALRQIDFRTLRQLARPGNGVLDPEEQRAFNAALAELRRGTSALVDESLARARQPEPQDLDPAMRRSYARTQRRLAEQARRARASFPAPVDDPPSHTAYPPEDPSHTPTRESPGVTDPSTDSDVAVDPADDPSLTSADDNVSPEMLQDEVEQTSDTLDLLERIASLQQQVLNRQEDQLLSETRGVFFAFVVSVAVIVAGVAPLVEASPHDRLLTVVWTLAVTVVGGLVYAGVRAFQGRRRDPRE